MERYIAGIRGGVAGRNKGVLNEEQREAKAKEVERFTKYSLGDLANKQLTTLKHVTVKRWREQLQQGRSPSSVNRIMTILRAGLNNALENRMVTNDMAWSLALKSIENVGSRRERYVTKDERRTLIENLREDFKPYVTLLCLLPLRPGDPERMLVKHYDPRSGTLTIPAGKTTIRRVSLSPQAEEVIRTACKGKLPGAYIFTQKNNNKWLKYSRREAVQNARTAAGFDNDVVLYAIRGSIITDMITGGTDPLTVARLSGTSLQMIQKHYGHLIDDRAREALARVSL
jgi:integrase